MSPHPKPPRRNTLFRTSLAPSLNCGTGLYTDHAAHHGALLFDPRTPEKPMGQVTGLK